jgi:NitT/TauT family transport system substrate-binding protein
MEHVSRRAFLQASAAWLGLGLAACGGAAAPAASTPSAQSAAASQPPAGSASAAASPKPAGSASAGASAKPAASGSAASAKPAGSTAAKPAASAAPSAAPSLAAGTLRIAWGQVTANQMTFPVAFDAGYFDKYGVKVNLEYVDGSAAGLPALVSGEFDTITLGGQAVVTAEAAGSDLVMVAGFINEAVLRMMATSDIKTVADLKGKSIGITKVGASDYVLWKSIISRQGWTDKDLTFVNGNNVAGQIALLQRGDAKAIFVSPPNDVLAEQAGGHLLLDTAKLDPPIASQQNGMVVSRKVLAAKRPAFVSIVKASVEAMHRWAVDPAFCKSVIAKYLKETNQKFVDVGYEAYVPVWPKVPYPSREGFANVVAEVASTDPKAKGLTYEQLTDVSLVKELEDSGFIQQVYGS